MKTTSLLLCLCLTALAMGAMIYGSLHDRRRTMLGGYPLILGQLSTPHISRMLRVCHLMVPHFTLFLTAPAVPAVLTCGKCL